MPTNHAAAILAWRSHVDNQPGGLETFDQSSTVSTMLFACNTWLSQYADMANEIEVDRITLIKSELEAWMIARGHLLTDL